MFLLRAEHAFICHSLAREDTTPRRRRQTDKEYLLPQALGTNSKWYQDSRNERKARAF